MSPEQIYQHLTELAERLQISVSEQNFRQTGVRVQSGLCTVKGKRVFVMDKNISIHKKIRLLAECIGQMPIDDVFMVPALREAIEKYIPKQGSEGS